MMRKHGDRNVWLDIQKSSSELAPGRVFRRAVQAVEEALAGWSSEGGKKPALEPKWAHRVLEIDSIRAGYVVISQQGPQWLWGQSAAVWLPAEKREDIQKWANAAAN